MSQFIVGVDVGQSVDPAAICVLEVTTRQDELNKLMANPEAKTDVPPDWYPKREGAVGLTHPDRIHRVDVRHLERLPLKMTYPEQIGRVAELLSRPPLDQPKARLVVDQTGVGKPIVEGFVRAGLFPIGIQLIVGADRSRVGYHPYEEYRVAKSLLVSHLQTLFHAGGIRISKELEEAQSLVFELQDFRASVTDTGYWRFGARNGQHDDLVLSLAIGVWYASRPRSETFIGMFYA